MKKEQQVIGEKNQLDSNMLVAIRIRPLDQRDKARRFPYC